MLDPFFGLGTVGAVCAEEHRHYLGIELNPRYADAARDRLGLADHDVKMSATEIASAIGSDSFYPSM